MMDLSTIQQGILNYLNLFFHFFNASTVYTNKDFPSGSVVTNSPAKQETQVGPLSQEDPL